MHQDRFYLPEITSHSEFWIEGREAHHILHVKRAKIGSKITLFDGKGNEYTAGIVKILRNKLKVLVEQSKAVERESNSDITIAFSIPKGKRSVFLIQKCAELGVKTLIPLHCERSIVDIRDKSVEKLERWSKILIETSKQCKRNLVTKIDKVKTFHELLKDICNYDLPLIACANNQTESLKNVLLAYPAAKTVICIIGPEGGFTDKELIHAKEAGCLPVHFGHFTLRIETAAIVLSSLLLYAHS